MRFDAEIIHEIILEIGKRKIRNQLREKYLKLLRIE